VKGGASLMNALGRPGSSQGAAGGSASEQQSPPQQQQPGQQGSNAANGNNQQQQLNMAMQNPVQMMQVCILNSLMRQCAEML
jgi:hypothetical protein